jgi:hypothetical protein
MVFQLGQYGVAAHFEKIWRKDWWCFLSLLIVSLLNNILREQGHDKGYFFISNLKNVCG